MSFGKNFVFFIFQIKDTEIQFPAISKIFTLMLILIKTHETHIKIYRCLFLSHTLTIIKYFVAIIMWRVYSIKWYLVVIFCICIFFFLKCYKELLDKYCFDFNVFLIKFSIADISGNLLMNYNITKQVETSWIFSR